jgi:hypothetical protein
MALVRIDEFTVENKKDGRRWRTNPDGTTSTIIPEGWKDNFVRIAKGEEHFNKWVKRLCEDKKDFTIIKNGSFWSIQSPTFDYLIKYKVKDRKNKLTGGKHLIPLVRKAVENYKEACKEYPDAIIRTSR